MASTPGELTTTLILALSQSQEQVKVLQEQAKRIEQLGKENERLRKELEDLKTTRQENENFQVEELFQQNVESRAEILRLKQKLKKYKDKATRQLGVPISSPVSAVTTSGSPRQTRPRTEPEEPVAQSEPRPSKRQRLDHPLKEIPAKSGHDRNSSTGTSRKSEVEKKVAAIPLLAEDGEGHITEAASKDVRQGSRKLDREGSLYKRLDGLLAAPTPDRAPLSRSVELEPFTPAQTLGTPAPAAKYNISNIKHVPRASNVSAKPNTSNPTTPLQETPRTGNKAQTRERLPPRRPVRSSRIGTPLRNQPVDQLRLSDFKPNPRWLDSHGVSYDDFLHGQNKSRLEELAKTLPAMPGQKMTDNELLAEIMGPGSEAAIPKLTAVARKNLLHEAKLKRVASAFGKQRIDYDRENDPPGFWDMDMPGTQEEAENRRIAIERDKVEVKRRYDDAISGQGRFVFADEIVA